MKRLFREHFLDFSHTLGPDEPVWQPRYYDFNVYSPKMARQKLEYMHFNPVRAGLVEKPEDWLHGSARWYLLKKPVGVLIDPSVLL